MKCKNLLLLLLLILFYSNSIVAQQSVQGKVTAIEETQKAPINLAEMLQPVQEYSVLAHDDYYVWGASMTTGNEDDKLYHLFYSRWPKELGFSGWWQKSEIAYATAPTPLGPYTYQKTILQGFGKDHWNENNAHNPHVKKFNGKYYLYFISEDLEDYGFDFRKNHIYSQRIGVAEADSPAGPWKVMDKPLIDYQEGKPATGYMVNPSVCQKPDGTYLMMFKSRAEGSENSKDFTAIQCTATSNSPTGPFIISDKPTLTEATAEDPFIWYQKDRYYAILDDQYGDYLKTGHGLALFESNNGTDWKPSAHILVSHPEIKWQNNTTTKLKFLERPQVGFNKNGEPIVLFCAAKIGDIPDTSDLSFNVHIPLYKIDK